MHATQIPVTSSSSPGSSFVTFSSVITPAIRSFAEPVFAAQQYTTIIDSILVSNIYSEPITIDMWIHRGVITQQADPTADPPTPEIREDQEFWLCRSFPLEGYTRMEMIPNSPIYLQPGGTQLDGTIWEGDIIHARSDALDHYFYCIVSYRSLTELQAR